MKKDEIVEYLKKNLEIRIRTGIVDYKTKYVELCLEDEVISKCQFRIK